MVGYRSVVATLVALAGCQFDTSGLPAVDDASSVTPTPDGRPDAGPEPNATRRRITIEPPTLDGPVPAFVAGVRLTGDDSLRTTARADGRDLLFALPDGSPLPAEIEHFDAEAGDLVAWVRVPMLTGAGRDLYLYYGEGNTAPADLPSPWDDADLVWHCAELEDGTTGDSSRHANNGSAPQGRTPSSTAGVFGPALDFDLGDLMWLPDANVLDVGTGSATLSLWFRQQSTNTAIDLLFYKGGFTPARNAGLDLELGSGGWYANAGDGQQFRQAKLGDEPDLRDDWHHLAIVIDRQDGAFRAYVDGEQTDSTNINNLDSLATEIVGRLGDSTNPIDGLIDEFRFYPHALSPDRLRLHAANGLDPDALLAVGPPEPALYPSPR